MFNSLSDMAVGRADHGILDSFVTRVYWPFIEPVLFPFFIFPKKLTWLTNFVFWHSFLLTAGTPLARIFRGHWMGVSSPQWLFNKIGLGALTEPEGLVHHDSLFVYKATPTVDKAFGLHAFFAILWLVSGYLQMGPIRVRSTAAHRRFGYFALMAFIGHMAGCLNNLFVDEAQHQTVAKMMLLSPVFLSITYFIRSFVSIKQKDIESHKDTAFLGFLYSIEGAGAIREVAQWQIWLKPYIAEVFQGPAACQALAGGRATNCVAAYCMRMLLVRWRTMYWVGAYAKTKHDLVFTKKFILEVMSSIAVGCVLVPAFSNPSFSDWINASPALSWALFLTYFTLTMIWYTCPSSGRRQKVGTHHSVRSTSIRNLTEPLPVLLSSRSVSFNMLDMKLD